MRSCRRILRSLILALAFGAATNSAHAQFPQPDETLPGFKATQLYSSFGTDNINVFSGDPGIVIPLGPEYTLSSGLTWQLKAYYSAKFWHLFQGYCQETSPCGGPVMVPRGQVTGYPTLGVGWTLELGYVTGTYNSVVNEFFGSYVSPDGQSHPFVIGGAFGSAVTEDGSQLRISRLLNQTFVVDQPDGTVLSFVHAYLRPRPVNGFDFSSDDRNNGNPRYVRYGLTSITDRFNQVVLNVQYQQPYPSESAWKVSSVTFPNTPGRSIFFNWGTYPTSDGNWDVLSSIDLPVAAPASTLHVAFSFLPSATLLRLPFDGGGSQTCLPAGPSTTNLPFLQSITQLSQEHSFEYLLTLDGINANGVLNAMTLPTGGRIEYDYAIATAPPPQRVDLFGNPEVVGTSLPLSRTGPTTASREVNGPYDDCSADAAFEIWIERSPAVITRRERASAGGAVLSEVRYYRDQFGSRDLPTDRFVDPERVVRRVIITRPDGNGARAATKVIFHATPYRYPMEVSRREYASLDTGAAPLRSVITCYDQYDNLVGNGCGVAAPDGRVQDFSEALFDRRSKTVTWFGANPAPAGGDCADSATPCWQRTMSGYNQAAFEYETEKRSSNSQLLLYQMDSRTVTTHWTPSVDSSHWILKLFDSRTVSDDYTSVPCPWQPCSVRTDYGFNFQNGFLNTFSITDPTYGTLRRAFQDDGVGNPALEVLSGDSPTGALTGFLVTRRTFAKGRVLTSQRDGIAWKAFDATRDAATGWIASSRDANGQQSSYDYDALGRLTRVTPPGGEAATTYCYVDWSAATPTQAAYVLAKKGIAVSCSPDDGFPSTGSGTLEAYQFDPFGRIQREVRRLPNALSTGSYLSFQETRYDAAGHRSFLSEWTPCGTSNGPTDVRSCFATSAVYGTTWSNYDFLGRPKRVVAADGTVTTHSYDDPAGIPNSDFVDLATQTRTYTDSSGQTVTGPLTGGFRKDILGRTLLVAEPGPAPFGPVTAYQYNVLDKLTMVNLAGTGVQQRTFAYDWFGFLRSETHPESGTTNHSAYDVLGDPLASTRADGSVVTRQYDQAGRLVRVIAGGQPYAVQCYDGGGCADGTGGFAGGAFPLGNLTRRYGWNPGSPSLTKITEDLSYTGLGGRLSDKTTTFSTGSLSPVTEHWFYDSMGLLRQHDHPRPSGGGPFVVSTLYSSARPIAEYANGLAVLRGVTYLPSGGLAAYTAGLGVGHNLTTTISADDSLLPRPKRFSATEQGSGSTLFDTGLYAYDPTGSPTAIGLDVFRYDAQSRLTYAGYSGSGSQTFTYDPYGNLLSRGAASYSVDASKNQLRAPYVYSPRGDLTGNGTETYGYDLLDRQTSYTSAVGTWSYLFAGDGERLVRVLPASLGSPVATLRDEQKRVSSEYVGGVTSRDDVYLGKLLVASYANIAAGSSVEAWHFHSSDHLGTPRLDVGLAGKVIDRNKYWPFGDEVASAQTSQRIRFAGMERDSESSRYYDHARSHDFAIGRFASVDHAGGTVDEPQSWHRYAYARNNPLARLDTNGLADAHFADARWEVAVSHSRDVSNQLGNIANAKIGSRSEVRNSVGIASVAARTDITHDSHQRSEISVSTTYVVGTDAGNVGVQVKTTSPLRTDTDFSDSTVSVQAASRATGSLSLGVAGPDMGNVTYTTPTLPGGGPMAQLSLSLSAYGMAIYESVVGFVSYKIEEFKDRNAVDPITLQSRYESVNSGKNCNRADRPCD